MRILVISPYFYPHLGGSERYIEGLYSAISKVDSSVKIDVLTYGYGKYVPVESYGSMTIYRVKGYELLPDQFSIPNYFQLVALIRRLKSKHYDIINAHTRFFESSWWTPLVGKYFKSKMVLTDHCASHPNHDLWIIRGIAKVMDKVGIPILGRFYNRITAVSQATKQFLVSNGINHGVRVIPNSVDLDLFENDKTRKTLVVSFIGRDIRAKGAHLFTKVVNHLARKYPDVIFKKVTNKSHKDVVDVLRQTSILVHPSMHHEGLPTIIIEAGAAKCAVIATDRGGTGEVIKNGNTGLIVNPTVEEIEVALEKLILEKRIRRQMGENLYRKVSQEYNWNKTAEKYLKYLKTLG